MSYVLLIVEDQDSRSGPIEQRRNRFERMMRFSDDLKTRGVLLASESLKSLRDGVRVQRRGGKPVVVDGPFAEAKEVVGGFFLLDCDTREEALAIAAQCPASEWSSVEVREVGPCYEQ